jgi:signal peptidase I
MGSTGYFLATILIGGGLLFLGLNERYSICHFDASREKQYDEPEIESGTWRVGKADATLSENVFVVFQRPGLDPAPHVARIVAVQGETVEVKDDQVLVDGRQVPGPVAGRDHSEVTVPAIVVPKGCVFVLHDERGKGSSFATDSRSLGPIPVEAISYAFSPSGKK